MLAAGAERVYYIETPDSQINMAVSTFLSTKNIGGPIVCESRNLRIAVIPGLFVLLKHFDENLIKQGFDFYERLADITLTIDPNTRNSGSISEKIIWDGKCWKFNV